MKLYKSITESKGHLSYSTWMKEAAEYYIKSKSTPMVFEEPKQNNGFDDFLEGF